MAIITQTYGSYAAALTACGDTGYDDDRIAEVVVRKTAAALNGASDRVVPTDPLAPLLLSIERALSRRTDRLLRVLELGGGAGDHYFTVARILGGIDLRWTVVETPALVRRAAATAALRTKGLAFTSSLAEGRAGLQTVDLLYCSAGLQYVPDPEATMAEMVGVGAPSLLLARFPMLDGYRRVGVQTSMLSANGPGPMPSDLKDRAVHYPVTFLPLPTLDSGFSGSYRTIVEFTSPSADYTLEGRRIPGGTRLMERKSPLVGGLG